MSPGSRSLVFVGLYLAAGAAFIYALWNTLGFPDSTPAAVGLGLLVVAANACVGFAVGSWWALLLPYALVLVAVPAGFPPAEGREVLPIWLVQAWLATFQAVFVLLGILAGKLGDRAGGSAR